MSCTRPKVVSPKLKNQIVIAKIGFYNTDLFIRQFKDVPFRIFKPLYINFFVIAVAVVKIESTYNK